MKLAINIALGIFLAFRMEAGQIWFSIAVLLLMAFFNFALFVYETTGIEYEIKRKIIEADLRRRNKELLKSMKQKDGEI